MNKIFNKNALFILIGFLFGILLTAVIAYGVITTKLEDAKGDYGNEVHALGSVVEEALPAIAQKDYVLAGLTLSSDFQELLEYGVQNGWWTEEFLTQVLIDDVIPVYIDQYAATIGAIKGTDQYQNIVDKVQEVIDTIAKLPKEEIKATVHKLLSMNFSLIQNKLFSIMSLVQDLPAIAEQLGGKLASVEDVVNTLKEKDIDAIVAKVTSLVNTINSLTPDDIKDAVLDTQKAQELLEKLEEVSSLLEKIPGILDSLGELKGEAAEIVENIKGIVEQLQETISIIESELSKITDALDNTFANVDDDFLFVEGENNILTVSFNLSKLEATILNAIDITIVEDSYSNNGTAVNLSDDTLVIGQIYLKFESSDKAGLDIVLGNITIKGKNAFLLHTNIGLINNAI